MSIEISNINPSRQDNVRRNNDDPLANKGPTTADSSESSRGGQESALNVSLSPTAVVLGQIESDVKSLPDVDLDKVAAIRQQIESGTYSSNTANLAQKMLDLE